MEMKQKALEFADIGKLDYEFKYPSLLVAGGAMQYYGLRESTKDVDLILHQDDFDALLRKFKKQGKIITKDAHSGYREKPGFVDLFGDHGIWIYQFELWDSIFNFNYEELVDGSIAEGDILVISLEKLMVLCGVRGMAKEVGEKRYFADTVLVTQRLVEEKYAGFEHEQDSYFNILLGEKK